MNYKALLALPLFVPAIAQAAPVATPKVAAIVQSIPLPKDGGPISVHGRIPAAAGTQAASSAAAPFHFGYNQFTCTGVIIYAAPNGYFYTFAFNTDGTYTTYAIQSPLQSAVGQGLITACGNTSSGSTPSSPTAVKGQYQIRIYDVNTGAYDAGLWFE